MNIITVIHADSVTAPLGQRSRLCDELCGVPVLRRTLTRVLRAASAGRVFVTCSPEHADAIRGVTSNLPVQVETTNAGRASYAELVSAGRVWGHHGWRGGILGMCAFDEDIHIPLCHALASREKADAVSFVSAHAALVAPDVIEQMVAHFHKVGSTMRVVFTQAPPGMAPVILHAALLSDLAPTGRPPGALIAYQPAQPAPDLTGRDACLRISADIASAPQRMLADTQRGFTRMERLIREGADEWNAERIATWLHKDAECGGDDCPGEIEIELTTAFPDGVGSLLRPRGAEVPNRGALPLNMLDQITPILRRGDDVRVILGGFGEPLLHPQWREIVATLKSSGAWCVAIRTSGLVGDSAVIDALMESGVDAIAVTIDAATSETFSKVHGVERFDEVRDRILAWNAARLERQSVCPLIVPEMVKSTDTLADMEAFFDGWMRVTGWVTIGGYSHCGGQRVDRAVMPMHPPKRVACRRLASRVTVLADGSVTACDQDFRGLHPLGKLDEATLAEIWDGQSRTALQQAHRELLLADRPLCAKCNEWHRP